MGRADELVAGLTGVFVRINSSVARWEAAQTRSVACLARLMDLAEQRAVALDASPGRWGVLAAVRDLPAALRATIHAAIATHMHQLKETMDTFLSVSVDIGIASDQATAMFQQQAPGLSLAEQAQASATAPSPAELVMWAQDIAIIYSRQARHKQTVFSGMDASLDNVTRIASEWDQITDQWDVEVARMLQAALFSQT